MGGGFLDGIEKGTGKRSPRRPKSTSGKNIWQAQGDWREAQRGGDRRAFASTQNSNFWKDLGRGTGNFIGTLGSMGTPHSLGTGLGDYIFGSDPNRQPEVMARRGVRPRNVLGEQPQFEETQLPDFMSFLQQAMDLVGGGTGGINYDPLRNDARNRHSEYDARLAAMYDQLAGSIRDDNQTIQGNYDQALTDNEARAQSTQESIQQASNVADDRNAEVLRNLGIEDAQSNIINEGRDLNTQTAQALSDVASRGQISGNALSQNQQGALQHNTNLAGAAGLEGNMQRARVQSELASLLAQYDMEEQRANQQASQSNFSNYMNLGNTLYEDAWRKLNYGDDLAREQYERQAAMNQPDPVSQAYQFLQEILAQREDLSMDDLLKYTQGIGNIGKLY